jgi:hypothetical protein
MEQVLPEETQKALWRQWVERATRGLVAANDMEEPESVPQKVRRQAIDSIRLPERKATWIN